VVTKINFDEGQIVNAGDLLIELENAEIRAQVAQAEASLRESRSQYERLKSLSETQAVSASQLEELEAEVGIGVAQRNAARARLANTRITAPFTGRVGFRHVSLGGYVQPSTVITTLDDASVIKLEFGVPEAFMSMLAPGLRVQANSIVYPDFSFEGDVATIDSRVDPITRSVPVIALVNNDEDLLKPGMFLTVDLLIHRDNVLMVPEEALTPRDGRQYVFVVKDGKAMEREIDIGSRVPGLAEVLGGLTDGDIVITEGSQKVRTGMAVSSLTGG
jgi:membrane fusion protein (multidrug efflux system)